MKRLLGYVLKRYWLACAFVVICIFISVLANVQGTMFMQTLIDQYIPVSYTHLDVYKRQPVHNLFVVNFPDNILLDIVISR